jgi:hypothetical protein
MKESLSFRTMATTLFVVLAVRYVLCIAAGLLFVWTMYQAWMPLLPGFSWPLTAKGFLVGLLWMVGYSLYGAALWVVPLQRSDATTGSARWVAPRWGWEGVLDPSTVRHQPNGRSLSPGLLSDHGNRDKLNDVRGQRK